jgi:hypothetical protein
MHKSLLIYNEYSYSFGQLTVFVKSVPQQAIDAQGGEEV